MLISYMQEERSKIIVVGLRGIFDAVYQEIKERLNTNAIISSTITASHIAVQYFKSHLNVIDKESDEMLKTAEIEWRTNDRRSGEIVLKGKTANIETGLLKLIDLRK